jgi:hypothetical protein
MPPERIGEFMVKRLNITYKVAEVGRIPEGWRARKSGDIGELNYGYTCAATVKNIQGQGSEEDENEMGESQSGE